MTDNRPSDTGAVVSADMDRIRTLEPWLPRHVTVRDARSALETWQAFRTPHEFIKWQEALKSDDSEFGRVCTKAIKKVSDMVRVETKLIAKVKSPSEEKAKETAEQVASPEKLAPQIEASRTHATPAPAETAVNTQVTSRALLAL